MTNVIYYATTHPLTDRARQVLKRARALAYGEEEVDFIEAAPGPGALNLGHIGLGDDCVRTINAQEMVTIPRAEYLVSAAMRRYAGTFEYRAPIEGGGVLWMDTETGSVDERWDTPTREYMRLFQYAWDEGPVQTTTNLDEMYALVEQANVSVAHMGHNFDWSAMYGKDSMKPLLLSSQRRLFDSKLAASVLFPAPEGYTGRDGRYHTEANAPAAAKRGWLSLDNLAFQFGVPGKEGDLQALAREFGGFGQIPLDDPRFMAYALQDVVTLRDNVSAMLQFVDIENYDWREQFFGGINAQISRNGLRVDVPAARRRVATLAHRKAELLSRLNKQYGLPTTGAAPWRTNPGKAAILALLADGGIVPSEIPDWPRTKTKNISLGGQAIITGTAGTPLEETGEFLAELMGQRPLAQQALDYTRADGKVHPELDTLQRSGRTSVTEPGLTTWSHRDEAKRVEKAYFLADSDDEMLVEFDFSQADARIVAAYSGDTEFAKRFEPGADAHEITGRAVFEEEYDEDPKGYRQTSKNLGHAYAYRARAKKLAATAKVPLAVAQRFVDAMDAAYAKVTSWQERAEKEGNSGWITNDWGRTMPVERGHSFTQAPALLGQSGTRELMVDGLIRLFEYDPRFILWLKATVHDAILMSIPKSELGWAVDKVVELMSCHWKPQGEFGQEMFFPVAHGKPGRTWEAASHG